MRLLIAQCRLQPVPGGGGVHQIEGAGIGVPILERGDVDFGGHARHRLARPFGQLCSHLDADHGEAPLQQGSNRDSSRASDLKKSVADLKPGDLHEVVEQLLRIAWSG